MKLDKKIAVYVPSNIKGIVDKEEQSFWTKKFQYKLSAIFGGSTTIKSEGAWIDSNKELVIEDINIVYSNYTGFYTSETFKEITDLILEMKEKMKQECISMEFEGTLNFV